MCPIVEPWNFTYKDWCGLSDDERTEIARCGLDTGADLSHSNYHARQVYSAVIHKLPIKLEVLLGQEPNRQLHYALQILCHGEASQDVLDWAIDLVTPAQVMEFLDKPIIAKYPALVAKYQEIANDWEQPWKLQ